MFKICAGRVLLTKVRTEDMKTSFQDIMNAKIADAANPGKARGRVIFIKAPIRESPNIIPASSYSTDIPERILVVIRTTKGNIKDV